VELEELVELGARNIKWSPCLKFFFFFLASRTKMTSCSSLSWVFFVLATSKTRTMNITHRPSSFFMLQAGRPRQQA
jgi:hypothetical protein